MYTYINIYRCIHIYIYIHVYIYTYIHIYIYIIGSIFGASEAHEEEQRQNLNEQPGAQSRVLSGSSFFHDFVGLGFRVLGFRI